MKLPNVRELLKNGNWGLKLLSLVLAVVIYYAIKSESAKGGFGGASSHDRPILKSS